MPQFPRLASFVLERLGPIEEEVAGDLVEEYQSGRSRLWVWYQVLGAVLINAARTVRANRRRSAIGIAFGWLVLLVQEYSLSISLAPISARVLLPHAVWMLVLTVGNGFTHFIVGVVIGRVCRPFGPPVVLAYLGTLVAAGVISNAFSLSSGAPWWTSVWTLGHLSIAAAASVIGATIADRSQDRRRRSLS